jgi:hypothetical protein
VARHGEGNTYRRRDDQVRDLRILADGEANEYGFEGPIVPDTEHGSKLLRDRQVQWEHYIGSRGDHEHTGVLVSAALGRPHDPAMRELIKEVWTEGYGAALYALLDIEQFNVEGLGTRAYSALAYDDPKPEA